MLEWTVVSALLCVILVLLYVFIWLKHRRMWAMAKKIPGPNFTRIMLRKDALVGCQPDKHLPIVLSYFEEFGPVVRFFIGSVLTVLLKDPDDIQTVLGDPGVKNRPKTSMKFVELLYGSGLLTLRDEKWKCHRKLIVPSFHARILQSFVDVFGTKSKILSENLKEVSDGRTVDILNQLGRCTMASLCDTVMGSQIKPLLAAWKSIDKDLYHSNMLILRLMYRPWFYFLPQLYALTPDGQIASNFKKMSKALSAGIIAQKLTDRLGSDVTNVGDRRDSSFIHALLDATEAKDAIVSPEEIGDEVIQMMAAGLGTTAITMSYVLMLVALHTEIQADIHQELDEVFGSDSRSASCEDIQKLSLLDRCIKETQRLLPVLSVIPREITKDIHLPSGYVLPDGCDVVMLIYATHRDPRYFPEPDKFYPDRWLPENKTSHPYAFLPFGAGPRNCIGRLYAQMQMKSILSQILREFTVKPVLDMETIIKSLVLAMTLFMKEEVGYPIRLARRK